MTKAKKTKSKSKKHAEEPKMEELSREELDQVQGGITGDMKTIIGGFKSVSGLSDAAETDLNIVKRIDKTGN